MGNFVFNATEIKDVYIIDVNTFEDSRGYFMETYNYNEFKENGIDQWQNGTPNEEMLLKDIKNGESYVVVDENGNITA